MNIPISGQSVYVEVNGLRHHLLSYGSGRPLLILPGITSPAATADFLATRIAKLGFAVHALDIRGRGQSDVAPSGAYRLEDYAADIAAIVAAQKWERPAVIGHSMGARIAAAYATTYAASDHGLIVLIDPPVCGPGRSKYPTSLESFMTQLAEAKAGATPEAVRRFYPKWPERELRLRLEVLPTCDETAVRESHAGFENEDFFAYWRKVTAPAAMICGAESPVVTAEAVADLRAVNPAIPLHIVPEAGHMIPWDNFEGFFSVLTPMLKRHL